MAAAMAHYSNIDASHNAFRDEGGSLTADLVALFKHLLDLGVDGDEHVVVGGHLLVAVVLLPLGPHSEMGAADCEDDINEPLAREL